MNHYQKDFSHIIDKYSNMYKKAIYHNEYIENTFDDINKTKKNLKTEIKEIYYKIDEKDYKIEDLQTDLKKQILLRFKEDLLNKALEGIENFKKNIEWKDFLIPALLVFLFFWVVSVLWYLVFSLFIWFKWFSDFLEEMLYYLLGIIILSSIEFIIRIIIRPINNKKTRKDSFINFTNNIEEICNSYYDKLIEVYELLWKKEYEDAKNRDNHYAKNNSHYYKDEYNYNNRHEYYDYQ